MHDALQPWKIILSIQRGQHVLHAGVATGRSWDSTARKLTLSGGGGWTMFGKRLVLNHGLATSFHSGDVLIDEEHPAGDWALTLTGSYRDIARGLVAETMKWGELPFRLPPLEGGSFTRTYGGYDMATVSDRLRDLANLQNTQEYRFTPSIDTSGRLTFLLESAKELIDHEYRLNATIPGQRIRMGTIDESSDSMTHQVYAIGGKNNDKTVTAKADTTRYMDSGMPLLQSSNTEHTTISDWKSLRQYARSQAALGAYSSESYQLFMGEEYDPHVGDWLDLRYEDDYMGRVQLQLKITDVQASSDSEWHTVQAKRR
jgi:hypothetical protein